MPRKKVKTPVSTKICTECGRKYKVYTTNE